MKGKGEGKMNLLSPLLGILIVVKEICINLLVKSSSSTAFRRKTANFSEVSHIPCLLPASHPLNWQSFGSSPANQYKWWTPWHLHLAICFHQHTNGCQPLALSILAKMKPPAVQLTPCMFLLNLLQNNGCISCLACFPWLAYHIHLSESDLIRCFVHLRF